MIYRRERDDQIRLEDQIDEIKDIYQKANDAFDRIIDWQGVYKNPPNTLPLYTSKQNLKGSGPFRYMETLLQDIQTIQGIMTKAYKILWNNFDDLLEEFRMKVMPTIDEATPTELRIV
jgi:hypothetical protein